MSIVVFSEESIQSLKPADSKVAVRGWLHVGGWYLENIG